MVKQEEKKEVLDRWEANQETKELEIPNVRMGVNQMYLINCLLFHFK